MWIRVHAGRPSTKTGLHDLFDLPGAIPTPLKCLAGELKIGPGPQLFILEDATATGKTEASILLAQMGVGTLDQVLLPASDTPLKREQAR